MPEDTTRALDELAAATGEFGRSLAKLSVATENAGHRLQSFGYALQGRNLGDEWQGKMSTYDFERRALKRRRPEPGRLTKTDVLLAVLGGLLWAFVVIQVYWGLVAI
jgi:hypothetical protein